MARKRPAVRKKSGGKSGEPRAAAHTPRATSRRAGPAALVVYIHGIGRHKPEAELKVEWDLALFGSDRGSQTRMAYWSDLVHPPATASSRRARLGTESAAAGDVVVEALRDAGLAQSERALPFAESLAASLGLPSSPVTSTGKKVMPLPAWARRPISRTFLKAFISDTAAYFFKADIREKMRARLKRVLPRDRQTPVAIVAHSHGSIVAAEALSELGDRINVVRFVTLGSPLGLQEVQDFLEVAPGAGHKPFIVPTGVESWHNFADLLDPVAFEKGLDGDFVFPPSAARGMAAAIVDEVIVNERTRRLVGFNPHSAAGYLAHPKVRKSVFEAIQRDVMTRFVVARDVAENLAVEQRHPVLIEILEPGYEALDETGDERVVRERAQARDVEPAGTAGTPAASRPASLSLQERIAKTRDEVESIVRGQAGEGIDGSGDVLAESVAHAIRDARIDPLRRFVAARLTPSEIRAIAVAHRDLNVYAVWSSASKRKLIGRSRSVLQADAALQSYGATGRGITWAVLDTGVRSRHPHFATHGNIVEVWDCTQQGPPVRVANDDDRDGHGSHVAGIIAGEQAQPEGTSGIRRIGLAPQARLIVYKVLNDRGEGEDAWIIKALDHITVKNENAATLAVHGINLSLGGPYDSTVYGCGFTPICQELRRLWRAGVLVVVASGNEGQLDVQTHDGEVEINSPMSIGDPANLEDCIAVGSVNADRPHLYGVSAFSSRGPTSDGRLKPDVVAPGERISSVNARYDADSGAHSGRTPYRSDSGTSMAAPHVSGLLAAFLSVRREFRGRPDEVKRILLDTCTDLGRDRYHQGRGMPNLMKMLLSV